MGQNQTLVQHQYQYFIEFRFQYQDQYQYCHSKTINFKIYIMINTFSDPNIKINISKSLNSITIYSTREGIFLRTGN